jgi:hypothetical protein
MVDTTDWEVTGCVASFLLNKTVDTTDWEVTGCVASGFENLDNFAYVQSFFVVSFSHLNTFL